VIDAASGSGLERDEELGYELHDGPGQLVTAIHLLAHRYADDLPADSPWRGRLFRLVALARQAKWEMDRMARGLTLTVLTEGQVNDSVSRLARQFELDSGITVLDQIRGAPSMSKGEAVSVLRISHQALMNAWQHARCSAMRLDVLLQPDEILLTVADDGIGLGRRWQSREGRLGMASMRRTAERARGTLKVGASSPHGVTVEARIPRNS
jgi:two-component system NarL family sensor kinase